MKRYEEHPNFFFNFTVFFVVVFFCVLIKVIRRITYVWCLNFRQFKKSMTENLICFVLIYF